MPGGGQLLLELLEGRPRGRRARPDPGQFLRPVALGRPQSGVEQPTGGVEDGSPDFGLGRDQLVGQRLGQTRDRRLARGVDGGIGHRGNSAVPARGIDDHAGPARFDHSGDEGQHAVGHAEDVDREAPGPVVRLLLPGPASPARGHAGVVEQEIAGPLGGEDVGGQCLDGFGRGDVGDDASDLPQLGQLLDRTIQDGLFDVGDHDLYALFEQGLDDASPDAGRSPGHHGHLAAQVFHSVGPPIIVPAEPTLTPT